VVQVARHRTGASAWWSRPRALAALAVAGAGLAVAVALPGSNDVASAGIQHAIFADDFDAARGTALDGAKWALDGDADKGLQDGDGRLLVTRLLRTRTAFAQPYGHAESRIKVGRAPGPWRAFGVIDQYGRVVSGKGRALRGGTDPTSGDHFHTYAIDWSPKVIVWSVDGRPTLRVFPDEPGRPLALVLNLATDGRSPVRMMVDFVRVSAGYGPGGSASSSASASASASTSPSAFASASVSASPTATPTGTPTPKPKAWKPFTKYAAGDLVTYKGVTYEVKEAHTSLPGWQPTVLPNLFTNQKWSKA
jgi:hypothetical protein